MEAQGTLGVRMRESTLDSVPVFQTRHKFSSCARMAASAMHGDRIMLQCLLRKAFGISTPPLNSVWPETRDFRREAGRIWWRQTIARLKLPAVTGQTSKFSGDNDTAPVGLAGILRLSLRWGYSNGQRRQP
jgi:hypothetical protein